MATAETFQPHDYGGKENKKKYKQRSPKEYDLSSIDKKMCLLVGGEDTHADKMYIKWLHDQLKTSVYISEKFEHFDSRDFMHGTEVRAFQEIVFEIIEAYEERIDP